jgi:transcriptional regulator with XRE-family HTH domain
MGAMENEAGALLAKLRKDAGYSQERLGEALEYDAAYISRMESGARRPSARYLRALAEFLSIPATGLFRAAGILKDTTALEQEIAEFVAAHPDAAGVFQYAHLHPEILPGLLSYARFLISQLGENDGTEPGGDVTGGHSRLRY